MKTQHTPGPWTQVYRHESDYAEIQNAHGGLVCNCSWDDASLIAAAPELLEALEGLCAEDFGTNGWSDTLEIYARLARAAVAKAKGE